MASPSVRKKAAPLALGERLQRLASPEQLLRDPGGKVAKPGPVEVAAAGDGLGQAVGGLEGGGQGLQVFHPGRPRLRQELTSAVYGGRGL